MSEPQITYLDKLEMKPVPLNSNNSSIKIQFYDKRETTNVNRDLVMSKVNAYIGLVYDKRKGDDKIPKPADLPIPNPPKMVVSLDKGEKMPEHLTLEQIDEPVLPSSITLQPPTVKEVEPELEKVPENVPEPEKVPEKQPPSEPVVVAPKKRKLKVVNKEVAKEVDLSTAEINGRLVSERLPKPEKIIMKAPTYYMANRKIYTQKLNELFKQYNKEILDEAAVASCDPKTTTNQTEMMIHQKVARDYLNLYTPYRGLLLYFGLGAGKTAASISIAEGMKSQKRIFVLTPASLKMNYFSELKKYGDPIFRKNQYWEFISTEGNPQYTDILSQVLSLPREFVIQNKGAWLVDITKSNSNFKDLNANDQKMLDEQLNHMIRTKYVDINYNGLSTDKLNTMVQKYGANPFDHSVVVIDEAHNLVSRIINKRNKPSSVSSRLYQMLMSATDVRIVLLSGTPIINYPAEVGVLFNILRGYITTWTFQIKPPTSIKTEDILKILDEEHFRYYDYVDYTNGELTITRNPFGFGYMKKSGINLGQKLNRSPSPKEAEVEQPIVGEVATTVLPAKPKKKLVIPKDTQKGGDVQVMIYETEMFTENDKKKKELNEPETDYEYEYEHETKPIIKTKPNNTNNIHCDKTRKIHHSVQDEILTTFLRKTIKRQPTAKPKLQPLSQNELDIEPNAEPMTEMKTTPNTPKSPKSPSPTDYYVVENGLVRLKDQPPEVESEINEKVEHEVERDYYNMANGEGEYGMIKGGADLVFHKYKGVHLDEQGKLSNEDFVKKLKNVLRKHGIEVNDIVKTENYKCLPDTIDDFNSQFVDTNSVVMKEVNLFKKRVLGLTSYFRSAQEALLPQFMKTTKDEIIHIVKCPMSDYQLEDYEEKRLAEIDREKALRLSNKKRAGKNDVLEDKISSTYRIYSRVACNFVFPPTLPRPLPFKTNNVDELLEKGKAEAHGLELGAESVLDNIINEGDEQMEVSDDQSLPNISDEYAKQIEQTIQRLKTELAENVRLESGEMSNVEVLSREGLKIHSPKYLELLKIVEDKENKGLHLLYSNFRTLEGIGIFKLILEKNGFAEFKLKKKDTEWEIEDTDADLSKPRFALYTGTESAEEKEMIRNIYNSNWDVLPPKISEKLKTIHSNNYYGEVIKILMITASGAEGINLENTRYVHIMEPYWHMTRIDQVVGRARRICSHKNLPEELRTVKVFLYVSVFSEPQIKGKKHIDLMTSDTSRLTSQPITTDEYLFESAQIKYNLNNQILRSIKESAIDCNLYSQLNKGENLVCYGNQYGKVASNDFSAYPQLEHDARMKEDINIRETTVKLSKITLNGVQYVYNKQTEELFDMDVYTNSKQLILVGHLREEGKKGKIFIPLKK